MLLKAVAGYHTSFLITLAIASHILAHSSSHSGILYPNNYPQKWWLVEIHLVACCKLWDISWRAIQKKTLSSSRFIHSDDNPSSHPFIWVLAWPRRPSPSASPPPRRRQWPSSARSPAAAAAKAAGRQSTMSYNYAVLAYTFVQIRDINLGMYSRLECTFIMKYSFKHYCFICKGHPTGLQSPDTQKMKAKAISLVSRYQWKMEARPSDKYDQPTGWFFWLVPP